jgi:hypothetical protein
VEEETMMRIDRVEKKIKILPGPAEETEYENFFISDAL